MYKPEFVDVLNNKKSNTGNIFFRNAWNKKHDIHSGDLYTSQVLDNVSITETVNDCLNPADIGCDIIFLRLLCGLSQRTIRSETKKDKDSCMSVYTDE